jgi:penicillin-binding protein 2
MVKIQKQSDTRNGHDYDVGPWIRLFGLTVVEGKQWDQAASSISIKSISTSAPRGEILDRYGRVLAGNMPSFTVRFSAATFPTNRSIRLPKILFTFLKLTGINITTIFR